MVHHDCKSVSLSVRACVRLCVHEHFSMVTHLYGGQGRLLLDSMYYSHYSDSSHQFSNIMPLK